MEKETFKPNSEARKWDGLYELDFKLEGVDYHAKFDFTVKWESSDESVGIRGGDWDELTSIEELIQYDEDGNDTKIEDISEELTNFLLLNVELWTD